MQKIRDSLMVTAQLIALVCIVNVLARVDTMQRENYEVPVAELTPQLTFDEARLARLVERQVATIPLPQNGRDGADGMTPVAPKVDYAVVRSMVAEEISKLPVPKDGANGKDAVAIPIELQTNVLTGNLEWRYAGDDSWQLLMEKCALLGVCDEQQ